VRERRRRSLRLLFLSAPDAPPLAPYHRQVIVAFHDAAPSSAGAHQRWAIAVVSSAMLGWGVLRFPTLAHDRAAEAAVEFAMRSEVEAVVLVGAGAAGGGPDAWPPTAIGRILKLPEGAGGAS
jgi:hypothetical protein